MTDSLRLQTDPDCWTPAWRHCVRRQDIKDAPPMDWPEVRARWIAAFGGVEMRGPVTPVAAERALARVVLPVARA